MTENILSINNNFIILESKLLKILFLLWNNQVCLNSRGCADSVNSGSDFIHPVFYKKGL